MLSGAASIPDTEAPIVGFLGCFADPNIGREAVYISDGGTPVLVRVVSRQADAITDFGDARLWSETTRIDLRVAEARLDRRSEARMKLKLDVTPDLVATMAAEVKAGEKAVTAAMREAGTGLKTAWRGQITSAGLGRRLANSIRTQTFPRAGESLDAAALVWSKAPVIVGAHDTGPLIRSRDGFWLAIPLPAAGKGFRGGKITPGKWERRRGLRLRFVYRRRGPSLLAAITHVAQRDGLV